MIDFPRATRVRLPARVDGEAVTLAVHQQGAGIPVVLCHGFPDLAVTWRHQLPELARAGFRAIAPDQRGYGGSDRPDAVEEYDLVHLAGDMAGLLDALGLEKAVFAGHDWGGNVAWAMPLLHPGRTAGVIGVGMPYRRPPSTTAIRAAWGGDDAGHYILWFQEPGAAEAVLDRQVRLCFEKMLRRNVSPEELAQRGAGSRRLDLNPFRTLTELELYGEPLLSGELLESYVEAFERTGFRGGINWYRNIDRNLALVPDRGTRRLGLPCLMLTAEWDFTTPPSEAAGMPGTCSDLEMHRIERAGHWLHQERPEEVNHRIVDWLRRRFR